jgi:hypothetical protein
MGSHRRPIIVELRSSAGVTALYSVACTLSVTPYKGYGRQGGRSLYSIEKTTELLRRRVGMGGREGGAYTL